MPGYFSNFPSINYNLNGVGNNIIVRNIFFRFKIIEALRSNTILFYDYYVKDNETPEDIANKYYKSSTKHWLVMMANDIVDGQFDWVMDYNTFQQFIISKYGSIAQAQTQTHHYNFTVSRTDSASQTTTTTTYTIDKSTYDQNTLVDISKHLGVDFVTGQTLLGPQFVIADSPLAPSQVINLQDGTSVTIKTVPSIVSCYDFEDQLNEEKRNIKLISREYLDQIQQEFVNLAAS